MIQSKFARPSFDPSALVLAVRKSGRGSSSPLVARPDPLRYSENDDGKEGRGFFWHPKAAAKGVASTVNEEKRVSSHEGGSSARYIESISAHRWR